ncbi:Transcription factor GTE4 [Apostasia shenzhenica]|uniref:Transcription factor GTE4 n=1 Tax=Apostasia shenzhenica TaxID=1088818 RepID=A0A2H9ZR39_9ASPA|nr:Transcription factor GTE4 [Apostasia shenzhenica]
MASGSLVDGVGDGSREKQRRGENKVYTRKTHNKGSKTNPNRNSLLPQQTQPLSSQQTLGTTTDDVNSSIQELHPPPPAPPALEDHRPALPNQSSAASEDEASSLNHKPYSNHLISNGQNRFVTINLTSKAKEEVRELRKKLTYELELVRSLARKLEARQLQLSAFNTGSAASAMGPNLSQLSANDVGASFNAKKAQAISEPASVATPAPVRRQLSVSVPSGTGGDHGIGEGVEKEKRTPKANQYYKNTDFVLGKEKLPPLESNKKSKVSGSKNSIKSVENKIYEQAFKKCGVLLSKLMKHKHGWVFNTPVNADALGLSDYHRIIKHPMDLGTVKFRLSTNWYKTPREFAEDVRLAFRNAMTYNPKGQDVHIMAEQLSMIFEERWPIIEAELVYLPYPPSLKRQTSLEVRKKLDRIDSTVHAASVELKTKPVNQIAYIGRPPALKKPKAKDPNKREMTFEEKQKLSNNLQKLPSEKLDMVVQIIRKRNLSLSQNEDEIEVDIDSVDTETLWELERFVTNYKKSLSKNKRKAELAILARAGTEQAVQDGERMMVGDSAPTDLSKQNKTAPGEKTVASSSPVTGQRNEENGSKTSSSSSSSSDSGSTSSGIVQILTVKVLLVLGQVLHSRLEHNMDYAGSWHSTAIHPSKVAPWAKSWRSQVLPGSSSFAVEDDLQQAEDP